MSYRAVTTKRAGDLGEAVVSKVVGEIPIVGPVFSALLGLTGVFDDPHAAVVRWQNNFVAATNAYKKQLAHELQADPTFRRRLLINSLRTLKSRLVKRAVR